VWDRRNVHIMVGLLLLYIGVALDAVSMKVTTEYDRTATFASLRTYGWLPTPPYMHAVAPDARDPRLLQEALDEPIRGAVDRILAAKRLTPAAPDAPADCYVVYYVAFGVGMNSDVLGAHYGYLTGWGSPFLGATPTTSLKVIEQGTLIVDILNRDKSTAIWRGKATGAVDHLRTGDERQRTIDTAVLKMFKRFPPKR
jgi:hypothetical protein